MTEKKLSPRELLDIYRYKGKLTPRFREDAVLRVSQGTPIKSALKAAGVCETTIRNWRRNAEDDVEGKYAQLFNELDSAWAQWQAYVASQLPRHVQRDARVCADIASKIMPEEYAPRQHVYVENPALAKFVRALDRLAAIPEDEALADFRLLDTSSAEPEEDTD